MWLSQYRSHNFQKELLNYDMIHDGSVKDMKSSLIKASPNKQFKNKLLMYMKVDTYYWANKKYLLIYILSLPPR